MKNTGIQRVFINYAIPSIVGMLIVSIQMLVDGVFLSKGAGPLGLAAVNLSMPLISVYLSVAIMIISGGIVICGIEQGRGKDTLCRGYTTLTFCVMLLSILILSLLLLLNLVPVCRILGADDEVLPYVKDYLSIIGGGFIFFCIPNFTEAFTRLAGKPNWVFYSGLICFVVNVLLDWVFILRWGWGMKGAAFATCIANTSAAIVLAPNVRMGKIKGGWKEIRRIFFNGSSEMLTSVSSAVTTFVFNWVLIKNIGHVGVAALTIVFYMNMIVNMSVFGLSQALYPLMSYSLGERDYLKIRKLLFVSLKLSGIIGFSVYFLLYFFKVEIVGLFSDGDRHLAILAQTAISYVTLHYLISFINIIGSSFHTAIERPVESVLIALCRSIIFVLVPLLVLPELIGDTGIWISTPIAEAATLFVTVPLTVCSMRGLRRQFAV